MAQEFENDDLFGDSLDTKMSFLEERKAANNDGIYRIQLDKAKDKKKGYRSVIRFLPNVTKEGKLGESAIEKITHYVNIPNNKEMSGFFDSPKNFGKEEHCGLSSLFYQLDKSKNAVLKEKAKCLQYSKKYYSYVLILEDEQQPELVGKIMIFQYGKTIADKIKTEMNGEITGEKCNVFKVETGKDFVLVVKEIQTGDETYPDYKNSSFKERSPLQIYVEGKGFKPVPIVDGKVAPKAQAMVKEFLMKREHNLDEFAPKRLTDEQQAKITEITNFLTGKVSASFNQSKSKPSSEDFDMEDVVSTESVTNSGGTKGSEDDDDFFNFD